MNKFKYYIQLPLIPVYFVCCFFTEALSAATYAYYETLGALKEHKNPYPVRS